MDHRELLTCLEQIKTIVCKEIQRCTASTSEDGDRPLNLSVNRTYKSPDILLDEWNDTKTLSSENINAESLHSENVHPYAEDDSDSSDSECEEILNISKLRAPLAEGWKRGTIIHSFSKNLKIEGKVGYYSPCSRIRLENIEQIRTVLRQQSSSLTTENFSFSVRPIVGTFIQKSNDNGTSIRIISEDEMTRRFEDRMILKSYTKQLKNAKQRFELQELRTSSNDNAQTPENDLSIRIEKKPLTCATKRPYSTAPSTDDHNSLPTNLVSQSVPLTTVNSLDLNEDEAFNLQHIMNAEMNLGMVDSFTSIEDFLGRDILSDLSSLLDAVSPTEKETTDHASSNVSPKKSSMISDCHKETDDIPHKKARFEIEYDSEVNIHQAVTSAILEAHLATEDLLSSSDSEGEVIEDVSKLQAPLDIGWRRETVIRSLTKNIHIRGDVSYYAPGSQIALKNIGRIKTVLDIGSFGLTLNNFSFSSRHIVGLFLQPLSNETDEFNRITDVEVAECLNLVVGQRNIVPDSLVDEGDMVRNEQDHLKQKEEGQYDCLNGNEEAQDNHTEDSAPVSSIIIETKKHFLREKHFTRRNYTMDLITQSYEFICDICNKSFSTKGILKAHIMIHTGKRRYKSLPCKTSFVKKGGLSEHLNTLKHKSNQEKCANVSSICINCGKHSSYYGKSFKKHLRQCREY